MQALVPPLQFRKILLVTTLGLLVGNVLLQRRLEALIEQSSRLAVPLLYLFPATHVSSSSG